MHSLAKASLALTLYLPAWGQSGLSLFHAHDVVLFQGDSITDGGRQRTGSDYNHIMGQDYAYILAATIGSEHPDLELNFVNRGIGGDRILDLTARWQEDTFSLHPNFLSILIGVNDTLSVGDRAETVDQFRTAYDRLLSTTITALPHTTILLGEPFILPVGKYKHDYKGWLSEVRLRQQVVLALAAKYHLPVVRYQDAFDKECTTTPADHWSWDGVHPTYAGHGLMAREWLRTVTALRPNNSGSSAF